MKLLITGKPRSGKSTLLSEIVADVSPRRGFITKELVKDQRRTGFVMEDMKGLSVVLAQTQDHTSLQVGRFYVHPEVLAQFTRNLLHPKTGELLYLDEIGQMQLYSNEFRLLVEAYLDAPNDFMATITNVYSDEFTERILSRNDTILFQSTKNNRAEVKKSLYIALSNKDFFNKLTPTLQTVVVGYANDYLNDDLYASFSKLFTNAIMYFQQDRISEISTEMYVVGGKTEEHFIRYESKSSWNCDCPLSNGNKPFDRPGDCSHIQAVRLYKAHFSS